MISVGRSWSPKRRLFFQRGDNSRIIKNIYRFIEGGEASLMGQQLRERDLAFPRLGEFRPKLGDASFQPDVALLENVKQARTPQTLRGRPEQRDRVGRPGLLSLCISKSAVQIQERFPVPPNGNRRAKFPEAHEVLFEERGEPFLYYVCFQKHRNESCSGRRVACNDEREAAARLLRQVQMTACNAFRSGSFLARSRKELSILKLICRFAWASRTLPRRAS